MGTPLIRIVMVESPSVPFSEVSYLYTSKCMCLGWEKVLCLETVQMCPHRGNCTIDSS